MVRSLRTHTWCTSSVQLVACALGTHLINQNKTRIPSYQTVQGRACGSTSISMLCASRVIPIVALRTHNLYPAERLLRVIFDALFFHIELLNELVERIGRPPKSPVPYPFEHDLVTKHRVEHINITTYLICGLSTQLSRFTPIFIVQDSFLLLRKSFPCKISTVVQKKVSSFEAIFAISPSHNTSHTTAWPSSCCPTTTVKAHCLFECSTPLPAPSRAVSTWYCYLRDKPNKLRTNHA